MINLYETIIALCQSKQVSGGKMCADLGLSRGMMTDLKMGRKKTLSAETLSKIAEYFDISVDRLLGKEPSERPRPEPSEEDIKFALFKGDREVTDEMYQEVLDYAEFVKQKYRKEKQ